VDNQVRLIFALAYNLGNCLRWLALPKSVKQRSLRTLRDKLIKIRAKVVSHSRYVTFQMAEVAVPPILFWEMFARIGQLRVCSELARGGCPNVRGESGFGWGVRREKREFRRQKTE